MLMPHSEETQYSHKGNLSSHISCLFGHIKCKKLGTALSLGIISLAAGCVYQYGGPPLEAYWPAPSRPPGSGGHLAWWAVLGVGLVLFVWMGLRMFLGFQANRGGQPLDREDAALLRTARDALAMLLKKRLKRLKPVARRF